MLKFLKKYPIEISAIIAIHFILIASQLLWLYTGLIILTFICSRAIRVITNRYAALALLFSGSIMLSIALKSFVFEIYHIPTSSMEDALFPGDRILVSKLNYGPKLTNTSYRFAGFSKIKRGDIVVFKLSGQKEYLIKRCVGLPGEHVKIANRKLIVNNKPLQEPGTLKHSYRIWVRDALIFENLAHQLRFFYNNRADNSKIYAQAILTREQKSKLLESPIIDSITFNKVPQEEYTFPQTSIVNWTMDDMGTIVVPRKGMKVILDPLNFELYKQVLNLYENVDTNIYSPRDGEFKTYVFKNHYYFMLGDNREYSIDSRFWGFLPENNIQGKAIYLLFNINNGDFDINRAMKMLGY